MSSGFNIYRKLEDGELLLVARRTDLQSAQELIGALEETFPAEYVIEEADELAN